MYFAVNQIIIIMARENKLPFLAYTDKGFHTKIIDDLGDKYKCYNHSTREEITVNI